MFRRAIELERDHPSRRLSDRADASYAALLKYADDLDEAEARLLALLAEARASGDLSSIAYSLGHLPHIALWRGQLGRARQFAQEHLDVAEQGSLAAQAEQARHNLGLVLVYEGRLDEGAAALASSLDAAVATNYDRHRAHGALGFAALSGGDPVTAAGHLDRWHAVLTAMHLREPGYSRWHLDYLASLVATGRLADARAFLDHLDAPGRRLRTALGRGGRADRARDGPRRERRAARRPGRGRAGARLVRRLAPAVRPGPDAADRRPAAAPGQGQAAGSGAARRGAPGVHRVRRRGLGGAGGGGAGPGQPAARPPPASSPRPNGGWPSSPPPG